MSNGVSGSRVRTVHLGLQAIRIEGAGQPRIRCEVPFRFLQKCRVK